MVRLSPGVARINESHSRINSILNCKTPNIHVRMRGPVVYYIICMRRSAVLPVTAMMVHRSYILIVSGCQN